MAAIEERAPGRRPGPHGRPRQRAPPPEAERDTAIEEARREAAARIATTETQRDSAIERARTDAEARVSAAHADGDQARRAAETVSCAVTSSRRQMA